jgi:membrane associated rhomboid family serine protease
VTSAILYAAVFAVGWLLLVWRRPAGRPPRITPWGAGLVVLVAAGWVAQLLRPVLLDEGMRETASVRAGEWWRLGTAIVLQDGGWIGAVFNLVALAVTVGLAGEVLAPLAGVLVFLLGGIAANLLTVLTFGQAGAGSSMATMVLLAVCVVVGLRNPSWREAGLVVVLVALAVVLLLLRDQHGLALALGLVVGAWMRRRHRVV